VVAIRSAGFIGGDLSFSGGVSVVSGGKDNMIGGAPPPSPAAVEAGRLSKAEAAMLHFCTDLNGLVGRVIVPVEMRNDKMDVLTAEIYAAAIEANLDYNAVLAGDSPLDTPTWMNNAARVLAKLRRNVPESTYHRVLEVWTGTKKDALDDPDAKYALDYAEGYFDTGKPEVDDLVDLATCLVDYAFTRQGLDDELVRATKKKPEELQRALEEAGGGKEEVPAPVSSNKAELLKKNERQLFVNSVMEALLDWKDSLFDRVVELRAVSIYRIAMVHAGLPTGDELAQKCWSGTVRHKGKHPNTLVTIGHASLALQQLLVERGRDPDSVPYQLIRDFCRTCGNDLGSRRHGCCMTDAIKQSSEQEHFQIMADWKLQSQFPSSLFGPAPSVDAVFKNGITTKGEGYLLRVTTREDGSSKYEIHVKELWAKGNWQEVVDREAGKRLARRVIDEAEKAKALAKPKRSLVFESTNTNTTTMDLAVKAQALAVKEQRQLQTRAYLDLAELKSLMNLGRSIRWLMTVVCGGVFLVTGKVVLLPILAVAWVMAYTLIDRKAIAAKKEQLALEPAESEKP
jgi:hypothetical protein